MDSDYIQFVRYKLQKRLKRLNTAGSTTFHHVLVQTWGFLQENAITNGILADLERRNPLTEAIANEILNGIAKVGDTESENDAICYFVVKKCAASSTTRSEMKVGRALSHEASPNDSIETFRVTYLEPLFDYIDEQIDDKRMTLALLKKFKHRCEWFRRTELLKQFNDATGQGEKTLATCLYEYLHDQGLQFHIEPQSASGKIDLISAQSGKDRLVADAKLFNPERGQDRNYIIKGFRQVYDYTKDFNESFGYLVIFKTCEQDLAIPTEHLESSIPFISHNNKTIFLLVIDIFDYQAPASKRGKLQAYEITPLQFVESLV
ncbi:MAG TPA: hypothetical protein PLX89_17830 [Verrucomicrobiota bacterium]|nr:hypothetical protein [Verrucomicrobiales bacterium]HRI14860.1 hypothetical protein [Verrucomicrobiota bacterium]